MRRLSRGRVDAVGHETRRDVERRRDAAAARLAIQPPLTNHERINHQNISNSRESDHMAEITAAVVKSLREKTGLPMMECKKALQATGGDEQAAVEWLRKDNIKMQETRLGRETAFGRMGLYADWDKGVGAMVELQCESAPVAGNAEFVSLANDLAKQLATGTGATTADELLDQPSPCKPGRRWASRCTTCSIASAKCSSSAASCASTASAAATCITTARPWACWSKSKAARPKRPRTSACTSRP